MVNVNVAYEKRDGSLISLAGARFPAEDEKSRNYKSEFNRL